MSLVEQEGENEYHGESFLERLLKHVIIYIMLCMLFTVMTH